MPYMYILSNVSNKVLYVGATNNLSRRLFEHKGKFSTESFTARYHVCKLVYYEYFDAILEARAREYQIKKWNRAWKERLINKINPQWKDLFDLELFR